MSKHAPSKKVAVATKERTPKEYGRDEVEVWLITHGFRKIGETRPGAISRYHPSGRAIHRMTFERGQWRMLRPNQECPFWTAVMRRHDESVLYTDFDLQLPVEHIAGFLGGVS